MPKAKKTPQAESGGAKAKKAAKKAAAAAPKKAAKKAAAATPKKAAKKAAAAAPKKAAKKTAAAAPKKAAKKTAAAPAPAPKKAAKKTATAVPEASTKQVAAAPPKKAVAAAPQSSGSEHDAAVARIEAKAAAAGVKLAEGASAKAIKAAEKTLGAALPEEVAAFYRRHDGAEGDDAVEGRELLSLSRMVDEWKIWKDLLDQGTFEDNDHGLPDPGVQKKWWIAAWVPVTYDGAGNHHVIDLAPAAGGTRGQILSFWHDDDPRTVVAKDFLTWLEGAHWGEGHEAADRGNASSDDDGDDDDDDDDDDEAAGSERRFEMEQKFWAIRLDGDSFTVRYGKLGTEGQEQLKSFDDEATAQKEHDKLVAAKTKKGYREV